MFRRLSKKHYAAIAFVGVLAITGVSVAYFTGGSGSGTGSGSVGSSTPWGVTTGTPTWSGTLTALYPGAGAANDTELIPFTVTNNGKGSQRLASLTPTIPTINNDAETAAGAEIVGCTANSFTATLDAGNPAVPATLSPGATYTGKLDLTMQDTGLNQDPCQGKAPAVTITATS